MLNTIMVMTIPTITIMDTATPTDAQIGIGSMQDTSLMQLLWLASPALPVGGFSYSEGLEAAIDNALVGEEADVVVWLSDQLHLSLARSDLPVLAMALTAWQAADFQQVAELNQWVLCTRESSELRAQTEQMGRSLTDVLRQQNKITPAQTDFLAALQTRPQKALTYPVAFALAASRSGASTQSCLVCYAFGWAENLMQAAIKSMPLGQTAGQRILAALMQQIPAAVENAMAVEYGQQQAFTPGIAILSSRHEAQYSRLFRS
jgi:urease accessory protein